MSQRTWLWNRHPSLAPLAGKYAYITDHLEGRVLDGSERSHLPASSRPPAAKEFFDADTGRTTGYPESDAYYNRIERYLVRHAQGEDPAAYEERKGLADYTPHFTSAVVKLAGMAFRVEQDGSRRWERSSEGGERLGALGTPEDPGSLIATIYDRAGAHASRGEIPYDNLFRLAAVLLCSYSEQWALVEGYRRQGEAVVAPPHIRLLQAESILDFEESAGMLQWVKVHVRLPRRKDARSASVLVDRFYIYRHEGFEIWEEHEGDDGERKAVLVQPLRGYGGPDNPDFAFWADRERTIPALPIFRVGLPIPLLGYLMAKKANAIFNLENALDFQLWTSSFPKLFLDVVDKDGLFDENLWDQFEKAVSKGWNMLPGKGHRFDAAPTEGADIKRQVLDQKVKGFYNSFFQTFSSSIERSATEVAASFSVGPEAFLTFLVETLDRLENAALWRLEQIAAPETPALWGAARIVRSTNFMPLDMPQEIDLLLQRTMPGGMIPLDAETATQLALRYLRTKGRLHLDDEAEKRLLKRMEEAIEKAEEEPKEPVLPEPNPQNLPEPQPE